MIFSVDIFWKSAQGNCPNCGKCITRNKKIIPAFFRFYKVPSECVSCGMTLRRKEGFFLGAIVWNYGIIVFGLLPVLLLVYALNWIPKDCAIYLAIACIFLAPPFFHALAWRLWIGTYYGFLPDQLPSHQQRIDD